MKPASTLSALEVDAPELTPAQELRRSVVNRKSTVQRIGDIEKNLAKEDAPINELRSSLLSDQRLYLEFSIAAILTVLLAVAFVWAPQFFALMVQVVLNANDGMSNLEKALLWESTYLIVVFSLAGARGGIINSVQRRIQFRIDVGLTNLAERASNGEIPMKAGRDAAEANADRVSKSTAWVLVQSRLDLALFSLSAFLCVTYLTFFLSWKMGLALIITLGIGFGLGYYRSHVGRILNELEMQLSRLVGEESSQESFLVGETKKCLDIPEATEAGAVSYTTAELLAQEQKADIQSRHGALHDVMALESEYSAKHEAILGVQSFIVFFASLVGIYVGATRVIQERNKYTPEELIERLFYFIACICAAKECQSVLCRLENTLPELRIVARLHRHHTLVSQKLIEVMHKKQLVLKGTPNKVIALMVILCVVMFAWTGFLVVKGGGYGCANIPATCSANPAPMSGPIVFNMVQRFNLVGGGCVLATSHNEMLAECRKNVYAVQRASSVETGKARRLAAARRLANSKPIKEGMRVDCPEDDIAPYMVDPGTGARVGEIMKKDGETILCSDFINLLSINGWSGIDFPKTLNKDDALAVAADYEVKMQDSVSPDVLARGAQVDMKVRLEFMDWTGAPNHFEADMDEFEEDNGTDSESDNQNRRLAGMLNRNKNKKAIIEKKPLVMKGKVAREQSVFQSKLRVRVELPESAEASENNTVSLQLFMGIDCRDTQSSQCTQKAVMPLTALGSSWKPGDKKAIDIEVPTQMPSHATPCSAAVPKDCIGSAVLASSSRAGFIASFAVSVLDDGRDDTVEDHDLITTFVMNSPHKCEGLHEIGTLDCMLQIEPQPAGTPLRTPGDTSCSELKLRSCTSNDKPAITSSNSVYDNGDIFKHIEYKHGEDSNTKGKAEWHLWVNKETNSATRFSYHTGKDCGCYPDHETFSFDENDGDYQQTSSRPYARYCLKPTRSFQPWSTNGLSLDQLPLDCKTPLAYMRGQLVPSSHLNHNLDAVKAAGQMTNVLPMVYTMHQQAWKATEEIIDCNRDDVPLSVVGGAVYLDQGLEKDTFGFNGKGLNNQWKGDGALKERRRWHWMTHEVETPSYMWKLVMPQEPSKKLDPIAFWIPNTEEATRDNLDKFVVSVKQLEELLKTHGYVTDGTRVDETFDDLVADKEKRADLKAWKQNVKNCRKAAPKEQWKREFCRMKKIDMPSCNFYIDEEEYWCFEKSQVTGVQARFAMQDSRCKDFKQNKERIQKDIAKGPPTRKIEESVKACEPNVERVCKEALCPTYKKLSDPPKPDLDCDTVCPEAAGTMLQTGMLPCDPEKETFGDCLDDLHKSLKEAGRHPALEAILRELTVKCICVSAKSDPQICYEGSFGIEKGKKWCQFYRTPSWLKIVEGKESEMIEPTCNHKEIK